MGIAGYRRRHFLEMREIFERGRQISAPLCCRSVTLTFGSDSVGFGLRCSRFCRAPCAPEIGVVFNPNLPRRWLPYGRASVLERENSMTRTWSFGVPSAAALLLSSALAQEGSQGRAP